MLIMHVVILPSAISHNDSVARSGVRVVEGARLEIAYLVLNRIVGSNPTRSAKTCTRSKLKLTLMLKVFDFSNK